MTFGLIKFLGHGVAGNFHGLRRLHRAYRQMDRDPSVFEAFCRHVDTANKVSHASFDVKPFESLRRCGLPSNVLERAARQKFVSRIFQPMLLPQFMMISANPNLKLIAPLPPVWRNELARQGIAMDEWRSKIAFTVIVVRSLAGGIRRFFNLLSHRDPAEPGVAAVFPNLPVKAAAEGMVGGESIETFVSWYRRSGVTDDQNETIWIETKGTPEPATSGTLCRNEPFPHIHDFRRRMLFVRDAVGLILHALAACILLRWQPAILLGEIMSLKYLSRLGKDGLAPRYVFNTLSAISRPLWSHWAAHQGSEVLLAFYSVNLIPIAFKDSFERWNYPGFEIMDWPAYLVWNEQQAAFLRDRCNQGSAKYLAQRCIGFSDAPLSVPDLPEGAVAVFDVTAQRPLSLARRGMYGDYYSAQVVCAFLRDTHSEIRAVGRLMVLKRKRDIDKNADPEYLATLQELAREPDVLLVDPSISAHRIVTRVAAVISLPFTSTALVAQTAQTPSSYYDPTEKLAFPPADPGVDTISGKEALGRWLRATVTAPHIPERVADG